MAHFYLFVFHQLCKVAVFHFIKRINKIPSNSKCGRNKNEKRVHLGCKEKMKKKKKKILVESKVIMMKMQIKLSKMINIFIIYRSLMAFNALLCMLPDFDHIYFFILLFFFPFSPYLPILCVQLNSYTRRDFSYSIFAS